MPRTNPLTRLSCTHMRSEFLDYPVLTELLHDAGIKLVDIGGRGSAFATFIPLAPLADYYVSEPDYAEAQRLKQQLPLKAPWRSVTVLSEAVASVRGHAPLYLTSELGMSSLLKPNLEVTELLSGGDVSSHRVDDGADGPFGRDGGTARVC